MSTEIQFTKEVRRLEPGQAVEDELNGGQGHPFEVAIEAGQYMHLVADQRGIDVVLVLRAPDGAQLAAIDSPTGDRGPEQLFLIPQTTGIYPVEVVSEEPTEVAGRYELRFHPPRPATEADRRHVQAFQIFQEGESLRRQGETEANRQAVAKYEQALSLWRGLANREWEAESLVRLAEVQQDYLRDWKAALAAVQEALPLVQALGSRRDLEGILLNRLGAIELRNGRIPEAIELHRTAIAIFQEIGAPGMEAGVLNNLGAAYYAADEAQKGLDTYRMGLERARTAGRWPEEEASALRGIGEILLSQGELEPALESLRQSLDIYQELKRSTETAHVLSRMSAITQRLGDLDAALSQQQEALATIQSTQDKDGEAVALNTLGTIRLLRKETAEAGAAYSQALDIARNRHNRFDEAISLLNLGRHRYDTGNPLEALRLHEEAATIFQGIGFRRGEVSTLYGCARALRALGDLPAARERLKTVVTGVEMLRAESGNLGLRSSYFATKQHYYELYIDILMNLHEQDRGAGFDLQALQLNERRRARSLLDTLSEPRPELQSEADPNLAAQHQQLQKRINNGNLKLEAALRDGNEADAATIEGKLDQLLIELGDLEARIRGGSTEPSPPPPALSDIQKLVGPWGLLLVYSLGEEKSQLWSLTADGALESHTLPPREQLETLARKIRAAWGREGGERKAASWAAELSREILGPVAGRLGERRLLIVADGALEALPFAALPDPRDLTNAPGDEERARPLVLSHEVVHLPSVSILAALRQARRRAAPPSWIGILADPVFSPDDPRVQDKAAAGGPRSPVNPNLARAAKDFEIESFERLPYTEVEAKAIAQLVPKHTRLALGVDANRDLVESQDLKRYRILHFATHGLLNSKHPELSGLVLSLVDPEGKPRDDGFLLAHEISNLDLRAHLVVLSACRTGLGDEVRGEGLVSLTRSFMQAGVPKVVVSLWNVNDRATSELMTRFYRALIEKGLRPSSALRCAQLSMRRKPEWSSPYFWAPFIFQGDWQTRSGPGEPPIEKQSAPSYPPPISDVDFPPPGSGGTPPCPDLD